jgi:NADH-quinone oxidoreductase subunit M
VKLLRLVGCVLLLLAAWVLPSFAHAHVGHQRAVIEGRKRPDVPREGKRGRAEVVLPNGKHMLELGPTPDGLAATFQLKNVGDGQLEVFSVALEVEDDTPRAPVGIGIQSSGRETKALAPGETRSYTIAWRSDQTLARQLHAYIAIQTDSAAPDATSYDPAPVVAIVADRRPVWQRSLLSILVWAPLLISLLAFVSWRVPAFNVRRLRLSAMAVAALLGLVSFAPAVTFVRVLSRDDGNWGLQHFERTSLGGGIDYFLAVDGMNVAMLPALLLLLLAVVVAVADTPQARATLGFSALATSAAVLFVVSQSMLLATVALAGFSVAVLALIHTAEQAESGARPRDRVALATTGFAFLSGTAAFGFLTHWLSRAAEHGRSLDGGNATIVDSLPEIARAASHGHALAHETPRLLGLPPAQAAVVLAFVAFVPFLAAAPMHGWLSSLAMRREGTVAALVAGLAALIGFLGLLRFTLQIFPQEASFIASIARVVGIVTLTWCGLRAAFSTDVRLLAARLASAGGGIVLVALGSITPQGLSAAVALTLTRATAIPLLLLAVGALVARTGGGRFARNDGFLNAAPRLALVWLTGVLGAACVGGAFFAVFLSVIASVGTAPWSAIAFGGGLVVLGAGIGRALAILSPVVPAWWQKSPRFEPHGGVLPDLRGREISWALLLGVLLVSFLVAPRFWLGMADATVLDCFRLLASPGPTQVS